MTQTILGDMAAATKILSTAFPVPTGLKSMAYFGSSGGRNGINLVRNGPTLATLGPTGTLSPSYVTLGQVGTQATMSPTIVGGSISGLSVGNPGTRYVVAPALTINGNGTGASATAAISGGGVSGTASLTGGINYTTATVAILGGNYAGLNAGVLRTTAFRDAGWTIWFAARASASSGPQSTVVSDFLNSSANAYTITLQNVDSGNGNQPTLVLYEAGQRRITMTLPGAATNWRLYCWTFSGGATGAHTIYNVTDNQTSSTYTASAAVGDASAYSFHWGPSPTPAQGTLPAQFPGLSDLAHGGIANTCLTLPAFQGIAANLRYNIGRRLITI